MCRIIGYANDVYNTLRRRRATAFVGDFGRTIHTHRALIKYGPGLSFGPLSSIISNTHWPTFQFSNILIHPLYNIISIRETIGNRVRFDIFFYIYSLFFYILLSKYIVYFMVMRDPPMFRHCYNTVTNDHKSHFSTLRLVVLTNFDAYILFFILGHVFVLKNWYAHLIMLNSKIFKCQCFFF